MSQEQLKYKQISSKLVGSNVVNFRLEDGTLVKVYVEMDRAGIAIERKAPDGSPLYNLGLSTRVTFESKDKTFFAPAPPIPTKGIDNKNDKEYTR
jgi:hypothetical protein